MPNYLAIKTTGSDPAKDEILEVCIFDESAHEKFASLVKPEHHDSWQDYQPSAKITPEKVAEYPTFAEIVPFIHKALDGQTLIVYDRKMISDFMGDSISRVSRILDMKEAMLQNLDKAPIFDSLSTLVGFGDPEKLIKILNSVVDLACCLNPNGKEKLVLGRAWSEAFAVWNVKQFLFEFLNCNKEDDDDTDDNGDIATDENWSRKSSGSVSPFGWDSLKHQHRTIVSAVSPSGPVDFHEGNVVTSCIEIGSAEDKKNFCRIVAATIIKLKCRHTRNDISPEQYWENEYSSLSTAEIVEKARADGIDFRAMLTDIVADLPDEEIRATDIPEVCTIIFADDITPDNYEQYLNWTITGVILSGEARDKILELQKKNKSRSQQK
ncbi:exonuclease domain-containing protein [Succinimonas amylolytica]|uniref:3'-5' exonuclease n=1 Tax=Succinimonas amylolytica TaxID=83769 RepID=UPI000360156B|nr:exonuclease domain-containing protein [Succinimonas amylolytica]